MPERALNMLLVEPETLLRRTVSLTARTLGLGEIHEAASPEAAQRLLRSLPFHGAVIAIDCQGPEECPYDLGLLDQIRAGESASPSTLPVAILAEHATSQLLRELSQRNVDRLILKPFRARLLLDAFAAFESLNPASKNGK
jgi:DNA-binding NarL/FixJ family response regulator